MSDNLIGIAQVLSALEKITREPRELLLRLFGPIADATGELLADKINAKRSANLERALRIALEQLRAIHAEPRPVNLVILMPIVQQASLEDRDDLVAQWAGLLASAATGEEIHTSYPKILSEIAPGEARLLNVLYRWETTSEDEGDRDLLKHARLSEESLPVFAINLGLRHGLINGVQTSLWKPDLTKWNNIRLTPLGADFVRVCRGPQAKNAERHRQTHGEAGVDA